MQNIILDTRQVQICSNFLQLVSPATIIGCLDDTGIVLLLMAKFHVFFVLLLCHQKENSMSITTTHVIAHVFTRGEPAAFERDPGSNVEILPKLFRWCNATPGGG